MVSGGLSKIATKMGKKIFCKVTPFAKKKQLVIEEIYKMNEEKLREIILSEVHKMNEKQIDNIILNS